RGLDSLWAVSTFLGASLTTAQAHRTAAKHHPRRIAIFGGSFDPIHHGHLSVARAADRRFNFDELHFIPASRPPHKLKQHLAPFPHRFAMVSLACTEHPHFVPSLAEAGEDFSGTQLHYSVDTVRYFRHVYHGDRLSFIIGADAFLDIPMWKEYETLLTLCDFIIANRPGIRPEALRLVIPPDLMARPDAKKEADPPSQVVAHLHKSKPSAPKSRPNSIRILAARPNIARDIAPQNGRCWISAALSCTFSASRHGAITISSASGAWPPSSNSPTSLTALRNETCPARSSATNTFPAKPFPTGHKAAVRGNDRGT